VGVGGVGGAAAACRVDLGGDAGGQELESCVNTVQLGRRAWWSLDS